MYSIRVVAVVGTVDPVSCSTSVKKIRTEKNPPKKSNIENARTMVSKIVIMALRRREYNN